MGRRSRFSIAKKDIVSFFDEQTSSIFTKKRLASIFYEQQGFWRLATSMRVTDFIDELIKTKHLKKHLFKFPNRSIILYTWKEFNFYSLLTNLKPNSYLCFHTALYLHNLTEQIPKQYYISSLRASKIKRDKNYTLDDIQQEAIDQSFAQKKVGSSRFATFNESRVFLLESHHAESIGIKEIPLENLSNTIKVTDLERTMIDAVVRPFYCGGIYEVLKAFELCADTISINRISSYLKILDFIYPYHQAIGFYLEKTGKYPTSAIEKIHRRFPKKRNMYLAYGHKDLLFSKEWQIYYPKSLGV